MVSLGTARAGGAVNDNLFVNLKDNIQIVMISIFYIFCGFLWINNIIIFVKIENERILSKKIILQEEVSNVMDNLDEIILSKSSDGLSFCNKKGDQVLENI
jgi:hypothetical protein